MGTAALGSPGFQECRALAWSHVAGEAWSLSLPPPRSLHPPQARTSTSHLHTRLPQEDHDLINEAQQGQEHRIPVVEPLAEEEREGDVGGSPAEQGQREGPACGWRAASGLRVHLQLSPGLS